MTAREIAKDFVSTMNPSMWAGVGQKPDNFDTRIKTYTIDGFYEYELDVSYDEDELGYVVMLEIRWADDGELVYVLDTQRVNSEDAIDRSSHSSASRRRRQSNTACRPQTGCR